MVRFRYHKSDMSMNKASFSEAEAFLAVVDRGGFGAAARELGITQSTVSRRIAALETRIGKRLVERTTRRVALTEAGLAFANDLRDVLARLADAENAVAISERGKRFRTQLGDFAINGSEGGHDPAPGWSGHRSKHLVAVINRGRISRIEAKSPSESAPEGACRTFRGRSWSISWYPEALRHQIFTACRIS